MKLAVTMLSFADLIESKKLTVEEFIKIGADLKLDGVDLLEYFWKDKEKEVKEIPELLKKHGLEIGAFYVGNNFTVEAADRQKQIDYVKEGICTASRLGATRLRIFGGSEDVADTEIRAERLKIVIDSIGKCVDLAIEKGVTLILENHGGIPLSSSELIEVIQAVDSPALMLNLDIGNLVYYRNENPLKAIELLYPHIEHVHVKDMVEFKHEYGNYKFCALGEGIVPVKESLQLLRQKGYKKYVSIEYEAWNSLESMIGVKKGIDYIRNIIF